MILVITWGDRIKIMLPFDFTVAPVYLNTLYLHNVNINANPNSNRRVFAY